MSLTEKLSDAVFGTRSRTFLSDQINDVLFNSTMDIVKSQSAQITSHAVERGSDVQDHAKYDPETITMNVIITDDSLSVTDPTSFLAKSVQERLDQLRDWRDSKKLLIFYSYEEDIENVLIENISESRSVETGKGRALALTLKKIFIASSLQVTLTTPVPKVGATATKTTSTAAPVSTTKSMLKGLF